jgi:putative NADH-flavin reductase
MIAVIGGTATAGKYAVAEFQKRDADFCCIVRDEAKALATMGDGVRLVTGRHNGCSVDRGGLCGL